MTNTQALHAGSPKRRAPWQYIRLSGEQEETSSFVLAAHRSGLGCVVLMDTTDETLGPGRYALITQRGQNAKIKFWSDNDLLVLSYIGTFPIMLIESQQIPEWFMLPKLRITGTDAYTH